VAPCYRAIPAAAAELVLGGVPAPVVSEALLQIRVVARVDDRFECQTLHLRRRVAEHFGHSPVREGGAQTGIEFVNAFVHRLDDLAEPLLAPLERVGRLLIGDVPAVSRFALLKVTAPDSRRLALRRDRR